MALPSPMSTGRNLNVHNIYVRSIYTLRPEGRFTRPRMCKRAIDSFRYFLNLLWLKRNKSKCEIAGIGILKGVSIELCGMKYVDLKNNLIKIYGIYFSYNKKIEIEGNFIEHIKNIDNVLKIRRARTRAVQGIIKDFKT